MTKILFVCSVAALALVNSAYAEESEACAARFKKLLVQSALWLPRQQAAYWKDIWKTRGRRLFLVNREPQDRFHKKLLWDPFAYPATLPPEIFKMKYAPSAPATMVMSMPGIVLLYDWVDRQYIKDIDAQAQNTPGANYAVALSSLNMMAVRSAAMETLGGSTAASDLARVLTDHRQQLEKWLDKAGAWNDLERLRQLHNLGVLKSDADVEEFSRIARAAISKAAKNSTDGEFAASVDREWVSAIQLSPYFEKRNERDHFLMGMLFTPPITVTLSRGSVGGNSYSDLELLNQILSGSDKRFEPLRSVASQTDPISLLRMAIQTLEAPELMEAKRQRWKSVDPELKGALPSFLDRPDFPAIAESGLVKDEMEIWERIWRDPKFSDLKAALKSGSASELEVLRLAIERLGSPKA